MTEPNERVAQSSVRTNSYLIDVDDVREMGRLVHQDRLLTANTGGLFPERGGDMSGIRAILDLACGPGGWALQVAQAYPHIDVTGVDISVPMIDYARAQAHMHGLTNVHFTQVDVMPTDAVRQLEFPDASFDIVNARLMLGFMAPTAWPVLVAECRRITRPGGVLRLTEGEYPLTNKPACERWSSLIAQGLKRLGQSFSPDGRHLGISPMLGKFLQDAGYRNVRHMAYAIDSSAGTEAHDSAYQDFMVALKLLRPFLTRTGVATEDELEILYHQALDEMDSQDYRAIGYMLCVWGERPDDPA